MKKSKILPKYTKILHNFNEINIFESHYAVVVRLFAVVGMVELQILLYILLVQYNEICLTALP